MKQEDFLKIGETLKKLPISYYTIKYKQKKLDKSHIMRTARFTHYSSASSHCHLPHKPISKLLQI